jgi:hypothetical protein
MANNAYQGSDFPPLVKVTNSELSIASFISPKVYINSAAVLRFNITVEFLSLHVLEHEAERKEHFHRIHLVLSKHMH